MFAMEKPQIRFLIPNVSEGDITLLLRIGLEVPDAQNNRCHSSRSRFVEQPVRDAV